MSERARTTLIPCEFEPRPHKARRAVHCTGQDREPQMPCVAVGPNPKSSALHVQRPEPPADHSTFCIARHRPGVQIVVTYCAAPPGACHNNFLKVTAGLGPGRMPRLRPPRAPLSHSCVGFVRINQYSRAVLRCKP